MEHIGERLKTIERNIELNSSDSVARDGFTQVPNFILRNPEISVGAKVVYAMFLSYAWHNHHCFPGQDRLAQDIGMSRVRVTQLSSELQAAGLIQITRRGQGRTNLYVINFVVKQRPTPRSKQAYLKR